MKSIKEIFGISPDIGAKTLEPNLWYIVYKYYAAHFPADEANKLADQYTNTITKEFEKLNG